jgi:hypothetical protein
MNKKKITDQELLDILNVDAKILARFKEIQQGTIREAKAMGRRKN